MNRVPIRPETLRWACDRAGLDLQDLAHRFPQLPAWEREEKQPTLKQLENFAKATHTPIGYLFLPEPPDERLPIPDFRTLGDKPAARPSPDLLDTVYAMQRRQGWLREERLEFEVEPFDFVGAARPADDPSAVGLEIRRIVGLAEGWAETTHTWEEAVAELRRMIERLGVMAVINGVVGNNTHRILRVEEFRGFALCDQYAPLIFVNGADAKSAQMFTLAHELAHIWLGAAGEGLSGFPNILPGGAAVERFCDRAAAEFLLPARELKTRWPSVKGDPKVFEVLARNFKISPIVAARRAMDLRLIGREQFFSFYKSYTSRERGQKQGATGGDFYRNQSARVGELFARHAISAAKEGRLSFREAYELTGLHGGAFQEYAERLGIGLT